MRRPKKPPPAVREWLCPLKRLVAAKHARRPADDDLVRLAALIVLADRRRLEAYWALGALFVDSRRVHQWSAAIDVIPPTPEAVYHITDTVRTIQKLEGRGFQPITESNFRLDRVVAGMLSVPTVAISAYIEACMARGMDHVGIVYHRATIERISKHMRGVMGEKALTSLRRPQRASLPGLCVGPASP